MTTKKLGIIIVTAVIALLFAVWFGGSWYASKKAQQKLEEFVSKYHLEKEVHWESVNASIFGGATISGVSIGSGKKAILIKKVEVDDFINDDDRKRINISVHALSDSHNKAPDFMIKDFAMMIGSREIAPLNADFELDVDYGDDEAEVGMRVDAPGVGVVSGHINLKKMGSVRSFVDELNSEELTSLTGFSSVIRVLAGLDEMAKSVRFIDAEFSVKDDGAMKRVLALFKRYSVTPLPSQNISKQQQAALASYSAQWEKDCLNGPSKGMKEICHNAKSFLIGEKSSLTLNIKSTTYHTLRDLSKADFSGLDIELD